MQSAPGPDVNSPFAGQPADASIALDVAALLTAYRSDRPDPTIASQRIRFGTSGHRGSAFDRSFNEWHVLAITQAICQYRRARSIQGPLFLGVDTHALSAPACASAMEVLAANGVDVMLSTNDEYTPTPAVSHAILAHNRGRGAELADGIVMTPSHNPPRDGGLKYNPPHGGPAGSDITQWIEDIANGFLQNGLVGVQRISHDRAMRVATTRRYDFLETYVADLGSVIDMAVIRDSGLRATVDPMGGAGVHYWSAIAERYHLDLSVTSETVDPRFVFMARDWDGQIRMDPSSAFVMQSLVQLVAQGQCDIGFACDTDHDRHGIVSPTTGLMFPDHYLAVAIDYLFRHRGQWDAHAAVGKTVVSSLLIDRLAAKLGRRLYEAPVGFKWFAQGLLDGSIGFAGEESAGATFLRRDGSVWTTDKDGMAAALLAAEIKARTGRDPGRLYEDLAETYGNPVALRIQAPANAAQRNALATITTNQIRATKLAGEKITSVHTTAGGNRAPIGGVRVGAHNGWFAARPSGTEDLYKIYAESFIGAEHLQRIAQEAQAIVDAVISTAAGAVAA